MNQIFNSKILVSALSVNPLMAFPRILHTEQSEAQSPRVTIMSSNIFPNLPSSANLPSIQALIIIYTPLIYLTILLLPTLPILFNIQNSNLPPGTWYTRFTNLVLKYHEWNGNRRTYIHNLHKRYGDSVRIGVKEFAFCGSEGVKGVYGNEGGELDKTGFYGLFRQLGFRTTFSTEKRLEVRFFFFFSSPVGIFLLWMSRKTGLERRERGAKRLSSYLVLQV